MTEETDLPKGSDSYNLASTGFIASGNVSEMKSQLMQYKFIHQILNDLDLNTESSQRPIPYSVKGKAYVTIHFEGYRINTLLLHKVEKRICLINDDPRTISFERIQTIANTIKNKFNTFTFTTGKKSYTYNNPDQGFNRIWGYFQDISDAQRLYEQMLDVVGFSPDWERLSEGSLPFPGNRFSNPPEKIQQVGLMVRTEEERPTANMKFKKATMKLPKIRKSFEIVTKHLDIIGTLPSFPTD